MELLIIHLLNVVILSAYLGLSLDILQGTAGLYNSLGHAAFFAVGAYGSALLSKAGVPWILCLVAAGRLLLQSWRFSMALSPPSGSRRDYFATVTMGIGEITRHVLNNWQEATGGPNGVIASPTSSCSAWRSNGAGTLLFGLGLLLV